MRYWPIVGVGAIVVVAWAAWPSAERGERGERAGEEAERFLHPRPTTVPEEQEEGEREQGFDEWVDTVHRAPPGVDWRAIEADNVRTLIAKRNTFGGRRAAPVGQWVERGSDNQAGSIFTVRRSLDGTHLVAGASAGGVWRSTDLDGTDWEPRGDNLFGGVHQLALLPGATAADPDVMIASPTWYGSVYRSADDGATWTIPAGLPGDLIGVRRILTATDGVVWLVGVTYSDSRVLRSVDGGLSFEDVLGLGGTYGDLWVPREGDGAAYALGRSNLYVSYDQGSSWADQPLPVNTDSGRLAGSEATDPPTLYVGAGGYYGSSFPVALYVTSDLGASWDQRTSMPDYWEVLTASSRDPDLVVYGGVDLHVSTDGGDSWRSPNTWDQYYNDPEHKLHADMMGVTVTPEPAGGETWYVGCHGGVYRSSNGFQDTLNLSLHGLRVGQYYSSHTSRTDPASIVLGAQDQGQQVTTTAQAVGESRFDFDQVISGDYGHLVSTDGTHDSWVFSVYPGFLLSMKTTGEQEFSYFPPDGNLPPWMPFLAPDPQGKNAAVLFGGGQLWRYERVGDYQWEPTPLSTQKFSGSVFGEYLSAFAFSESDPNLGWGITSVGRIFRSTDQGVTWKESTGTGPAGNWLYGSTVLPSHLDTSRVYFAGSGYDGPSVWVSTDGGKTISAWDDGLPPTMVYTLSEARDGTGRVVAGTENTVYVRGPTDVAWVEAVGTAAPIVNYWSSEPLFTENTIRFSTFGRGMWDFRLDPQGEGCWATKDADSDGVVCELDCDDLAATVFPGAAESCDGVDSDCDGTAELDGDGDGSFACEDCDDAEPLSFPGNPEVQCDDVDNDCDGAEVCDPVAEDGGDKGGGGCGCDGTGAGSGLALLLTAIAALRRGPRGPSARAPRG